MKLGKKPPRRDPRTLVLAKYTAALPPSPTVVDWSGRTLPDIKPYEDTCDGVMLDVLNHWKANPVAGHKLDAYCSIDTSNRDDIYDSVWLFGAAYIGLALPLSAQRQESWDVVGDGKTGYAESGSLGGCWAVVCSVMPEGLICITNGTFKHMTWRFWGQYCDEAYACINKKWALTNGKAPSGFNWAMLDKDLSSL